MLSIILFFLFVLFVFVYLCYYCQTTTIEYNGNKLSNEILDFGLGDTFISPYLHRKARIPVIPSSQPLIYNVDDKELKEELAKFIKNDYKLNFDDLFLSVGSANVYSIILSELKSKAEYIIYTPPTYGLVLDLGKEYGYQLSKTQTTNVNKSIEYIVTPNNPTNEIKISNFNTKYKLYDISYFSYCTDEERQIIREDIENSKKNSIVYVVGSMSKEFLTPGYRVGFLLCYDAINEECKTFKNIFFNSIIALGGNNLYAAISRIRNNNPRLLEMLKKILIKRNQILKDILQDHVEIQSLPNSPYFYCKDNGNFQLTLDELKITYRTGKMSYMTPENHYTRLNLYQTNKNFDELIKRLKTKY